MHTYTLTTPLDANGQPLRIFKANHKINVSKAIDQLSGICSGILADGVVNEAEAAFFAEWVRKFAPFEPEWPFRDILARVERIFADGRCDDDEREELKGMMEALCGYPAKAKPAETYSTTLPLDSPPPDPVLFPGRVFNITGRFAFGTRRKVMEAIEARGGRPSDAAPTYKSHYLLIGVFASRDWVSTNYGHKIEQAVALRGSRRSGGIALISEEHWKRFVV